MSSAVISRRLMWGPTREHALEVDVVAEGARPHMLQALGREEHRRRRQGDHRDTLAIADGLTADRLARHRIEHADQVGRHGERLLVEPGHDPLVLEIELHDRAAPAVRAVEPGAPAQKTLGGAALDVHHLAFEQDLAGLDAEDRGDRILMLALRLAHGTAETEERR